ncbi:NADP-dependent oxidoreductase [Lentibacillus jeotgali]|uniref:NADP-dependent oxidoreductase n=1 Tax=Lentibacillus jeotgali TaxID=558169 RepID=UPI000315B7AC|nr:NADP-dependent oxidoreductase [Lentibacillus jeotgali]
MALGEKVSSFKVGDKVYAPGFLNPKGGFYAEYVALDSKYVFCIPDNLTLSEAGVISGVGLTALRGLEDILELEQDETIMIFGASGGIGHLSVQLAKNMGARVFAIASGDDGVTMVKNLGVDDVVNGRKDDILSAASTFAPNGFDAALLTAGGEFAQKSIRNIRSNGRIAYPNGIFPEPEVASGIRSIGYNGDPDHEVMCRLNKYIKLWNLTAHIDQTFLLKDARDAHLALNNHYLGKLCLNI